MFVRKGLLTDSLSSSSSLPFSPPLPPAPLLFLSSLLCSSPLLPTQPERVLQALKRYMAAEQKDRRHTLRHYQHIEAVDPQKAEQMKFQVCLCVYRFYYSCDNQKSPQVNKGKIEVINKYVWS